VTHVEWTATPGHPGAHCVDFTVIALDGRAGRIDSATIIAAHEHLVVRGRMVDRWRRSILRRTAVTDVDRDARTVRVSLTRAEIRRLPAFTGEPLPNGLFAAVALVVIFPASLAVGGWIGIVATVVAITTTVRLLLDSHGTARAGSIKS
jgi:hypothetical protein